MTYSQLSGHRPMIFDEVRNAAYLKALRALITPDTVVLDVGAGAGTLGLLAAAAGAKRVYLVEPQSVVQLAHEVARANGLTDRIVVLQGKMEAVELPEKVDLILSVCTGNLLYSEDLLPALFNARDRYLKPGGHMLPDQAELWLAPVTASSLHQTHVERWSQASLGMDFSAGRRFAANDIVWLPRKELAAVSFGELAGGVMVNKADLQHDTRADCAGSAVCAVATTGTCHALLGWIRIKLGAEWLSTATDCAELHWLNAVLPLDPPLLLVAGESAMISLQRPAWGDWTWSLTAQAGKRRHSSFLARPAAPGEYLGKAPDYQPQRSELGSAALHILKLLDGVQTNRQLAHSLMDNFPLHFNNASDAERFVQRLLLRYGSNG